MNISKELNLNPQQTFNKVFQENMEQAKRDFESGLRCTRDEVVKAVNEEIKDS